MAQSQSSFALTFYIKTKVEINVYLWARGGHVTHIKLRYYKQMYVYLQEFQLS